MALGLSMDREYMEKQCVIIGGGVAGLSAAIRLTELGIHPLVIEAGTYPSHKVCGEFFSSRSMDLLNRWGIQTVPIEKIRLHTPSRTLELNLPKPAGSLSHFVFDPQLVKKAEENGAIVLTQTQVSAISTGRILLRSGDSIETDRVVVAAGRLPNIINSQPRIMYKGIKAHFSGIPLKNTLEMFIFENAYLGIAPIEEGKCNIACLARTQEDPERVIASLMRRNPLLNDYLSNGKNLFLTWMCAHIPEFGVKKNEGDFYFIGDAAATIPPATGNGLTMALGGGLLVADYVIKKDPKGFNRAWNKQIRNRIFWGKLLNRMMLNPSFSHIGFFLAEHFPIIANYWH